MKAGKLPWQQGGYEKKWATKPKRTVSSPEYKQLKRFIHMPYSKIDHMGVKCYYFPTYNFLKIKNIAEFDLQSLSAKINGELVIKIRIDYEDKFSYYHQNGQKDQKEELNIRQALEKLFKTKFPSSQAQDNDDPYLIDIWSCYRQSKQAHRVSEPHQGTIDSQQEQRYNRKKYIYVQLNRDDPLRLPSKKIKEGQIKQELINNSQGVFVVWTIQKQFKIALTPGNIWQDLIAPFNLLKFKLKLSFEDLDLELKTGEDVKDVEDVKFKFNCMRRVGKDSQQERKHIFQQITFSDDGTLGQFDIAEKFLDVKCSKYFSNNHHSDISSEYRSFKDITFTIPFYKYPVMDSLTIFIPLVLINFFTLFTFVQGPNFNDKIGNIATLMIVYVGLMPVISQSLPPTANVTLIDIVLYCQLTISVLCLVRGFFIRNYSSDTFDKNYEVWQDPIFIVSVAVAAFTGVVLAFLLTYYVIMHYYYYNLQEADISQIDHKLTHWVSPHMHNIAHNIRTRVLKNEAAADAARQASNPQQRENQR